MSSKASLALVCCVLTSTIVLAQGQGGRAQNQPAPDPTRELTTPDIPGVVAGGTKVQFIRAGFNGTEGVIAMPDGSVLFTEQDANKIIKIDPAGSLSTYLEDTNRTVGLGYDSKGRLIAAQSREPRIGVLSPTRTVLADSFEGQPLVRPNDLVIDKKGGIYFSDPIPNAQAQFRDPPAGRKPLLFYITPAGKVTKLTEYVTAPNGVQLSPDEKILYATNGTHIVAFDIQPDGSVTNPRKFADTGGDGMAIDNAGRLYTAVGDGIRVVSPQGQILGTIPTPVGMQSIGFAGRDKKTMFAVGRGAAYRIQMLAEGLRSRAK
jgi:gluconolactonase